MAIGIGSAGPYGLVQQHFEAMAKLRAQIDYERQMAYALGVQAEQSKPQSIQHTPSQAAYIEWMQGAWKGRTFDVVRPERMHGEATKYDWHRQTVTVTATTGDPKAEQAADALAAILQAELERIEREFAEPLFVDPLSPIDQWQQRARDKARARAIIDGRDPDLPATGSGTAAGAQVRSGTAPDTPSPIERAVRASQRRQDHRLGAEAWRADRQ